MRVFLWLLVLEALLILQVFGCFVGQVFYLLFLLCSFFFKKIFFMGHGWGKK